MTKREVKVCLLKFLMVKASSECSKPCVKCGWFVSETEADARYLKRTASLKKAKQKTFCSRGGCA